MAIHRLTTVSSALVICAFAVALHAQVPQASARSDTAARDTTTATLIGRVVDSAGVGLVGAEITLLKSDKVYSISGDSGAFRIAGLPPGTVVFNVRRIGYEAATFTAVLRGGRTHRTNFALSASAHELPTVAVSDTAVQTHWLDSFNSKKSGGRGTFITRSEIVKRGARSGIDIIRSVPGVRIVSGRQGTMNRVIMTRTANRACQPAMYLHGLPYSGTMDDFMADDIEALEVYVGESEIPPEFDRNGRGICGVINVWTRDPRKAP